ncbi:LTA synthase family protein [Paenibacillus sp. P2(2022)]|uniref:LTA synthase family protein n=1 Tax=Paenibacillus TaxID=44249 RepID=UPI0005ED391E|nr:MULTISPECIES: LTA synthase family protein [Paenibacillus]AUS25973.1 phosphoglycerol transferase [Paenibacillus polymyxa]KJK32517.1 phosphoglycerol transferase [Paenibacillus polymyxa]MDG0053919.1 LTA synthase family protein [Paenibacillus sp. P2(2022)]
MLVIRTTSARRTGNMFSRLLLSQYFGLVLFFVLMIGKLVLIHYNLHAQNIDMNPLDYVIAIGSLLLVSFWTLWLPRRGRLIALVVLDILLTALIYSDMVYYRYFQDFITIPVLLQAGQVDSLGGSIASLMYWWDIFFFADWILFIPYVIFVASLRRRFTTNDHYLEASRSSFTKKFLFRFSKGALAFLIGYVLTFGPIKIYTSTWATGIFVGNWWSMALYNVTGLIGFHGYDIYRYGQDHLGPQPTLAQVESDKDKEWFNQHQKLLQVKNDLYGKYKGKNVMVIQAEAFMNFFIGKQINGQAITPNFDKLTKESMYFNNYFHQTAQGRTSDADFSTHASLHPLPTGSVFIRYADHKFDTLPSILKDTGYSPNAFHVYDSSFWNRYTMYKAMNYDKFYSKKDFKIDEPLGWSLGDKSFFRQTLNDLTTEVKQPFYAYMVGISSHHPYNLSPDAVDLDVGEFEGTMFGDYLKSVHYVDEALGELVDQMKKDGLWDNTILMFYGDHDNSINDKALYEKFLGKPLTDLDMQKIMNQVPLLVHLPDGSQAGTYTEPAGQLDLTPSVMHLLGISTKPYHFMGNDLFSGKPRMVVLRTGAFTDGRVYYIPSEDGTFSKGTCYNLSTGQPTDVNACGPGYTEALNRLNISDQVITYDLIREWETEAKK